MIWSNLTIMTPFLKIASSPLTRAVSVALVCRRRHRSHQPPGTGGFVTWLQ